MNTLADWAYLAVDKHFKKVLKHEAGVLENKDIEELHQMRVGMRRLRSSIDGFAIVLKLPNKANTIQVGKIARILGELRDLDVMNEVLQSFVPQIPQQENKELESVFKILGTERKRSFKKVKAGLSSGQYLELKDGFNEWLKSPYYSRMSELSITAILPDLLLPQLSRFFLYPTWYLSEVTHDDLKELNEYSESFHSLRKEAKRLRYNLELFNEGSSESYQYYLQEISQIQTILGNIQDDFILRQFLKDILEVELEKVTPTLADILEKNSLEKWQQWQIQKAKFLSPEFKKACYQAILGTDLKIK